MHATAGNISARIEDGYIITPTDACLCFLEPDPLSKVAHSREQVAGDRHWAMSR
ncbi:class II aldolase/adducin family protein [Cupriavidus basilensis]